MTVLYSRVVYSLWFKKEDHDLENTRQVLKNDSININTTTIYITGLFFQPRLELIWLNCDPFAVHVS